MGAEDFQLRPAFGAVLLSFRILTLALRTFHVRCPLWKVMPFVRQRGYVCYDSTPSSGPKWVIQTLQLLQVPLEAHFLEHGFGFVEIFRCGDAVEFFIRAIGL